MEYGYNMSTSNFESDGYNNTLNHKKKKKKELKFWKNNYLTIIKKKIQNNLCVFLLDSSAYVNYSPMINLI